MSKIAVVYYSGSGNTEAMADTIVNACGAEKIEADAFNAAKAAEFDAIAFGCPAMGDEVLEETIFQPMWDDVKGQLAGKKVALFGSYGWGGGEWMNPWKADAEAAGLVLVADPLAIENAPDDAGKAACQDLGKALATA